MFTSSNLASEDESSWLSPNIVISIIMWFVLLPGFIPPFLTPSPFSSANYFHIFVALVSFAPYIRNVNWFLVWSAHLIHSLFPHFFFFLGRDGIPTTSSTWACKLGLVN